MAGPLLGGIVVDNLGWKTLFIIVTTVHGLSILPMIAIRDSGKLLLETKSTSVESASEHGQRRVLFLMILLWFILGLGFGIVNPLIPLYLTEKFESTKTQIGIFTSIGFGVTGAISQVLSARLADRLGNRRFLLYCCSVIPFTLFIWPSRRTYSEVLGLRMIGMAAWTASWSPGVATVMEASPTRKRVLFSGLFEASVRLGMTIGPTLGGVLWEDWGLKLHSTLLPSFWRHPYLQLCSYRGLSHHLSPRGAYTLCRAKTEWFRSRGDNWTNFCVRTNC